MGSRKRRRERDVKHKKRSRSRSRSRSPLSTPPPPTLQSASSKYDRDDSGSLDRQRERDRDRERRHHKRQKDHHRHKHHSTDQSSRERERARNSEPEYHSDSSDVVEVPIAPPAPIISKKRKSPSPIPENGAGDCLSIEETNKLRAKLGLKPLEVDTKSDTRKPSDEQSKERNEMRKDEWGEFYHKPAENLSEKVQAEKLREKFRQRKEKRALEGKLKTVKTLGEADDFDDINDWVEKSREKEKLKAEANRRAKMLEEMDAEFGVDELVKKDIRENTRKMYNDRHLSGLRVEHNVEEFSEGKSVILTLKDYDVLDESASDTLVNVNMIDNERYRKNVENKKQNPNHYGYNVYEEQFDEFGHPIEKNILSKYDEEIGESSRNAGFVIGHNAGEEREKHRKLLEIKAKLSGKRLESLAESLIAPASDVYSEQEMAKFKKPKKKIKKLRQKFRAEDLLPLDGDEISSSKDLGRRHARRHADDNIDTDDVPNIPMSDTNMKVEEEDNELEQILSKARRLKQSEALITKALDINPSEMKVEVKTEKNSDDEHNDNPDNNITLNATAEFCRTLGDIPTYGMSGNRDIDTNDMMVIESDSDAPDEHIEEEEPSGGTWNTVDTELEKAPSDKQIAMSDVAILDEEPDVGTSVGAALKLALSKGYLEKEESNRPSNTRMAHLQAKNYSIEDKAYGEDDKFNRRDRFQSGPIMEFKERDTYKPNVKLEYIDDNGRILNEKEAFRYLSHKFHGKGPGKNKIEKRLKKSEQDGLMKKMSSTDTPLGTLTMLQHKQKETHSPYIVLSGSKQTHAATSITKQK